ncbi:hypothetical protein BpHYR1_013133 [Brachionus plicatilis]|uniref:Secreted protein n=1 Tax=Brachionus plicatilis TaxID=10195 RepID=A0A3M7Q8A6_BRAPC|nr:hypothetical protein BpHYR1_013133 [Brachionus plicatilis]
MIKNRCLVTTALWMILNFSIRVCQRTLRHHHLASFDNVSNIRGSHLMSCYVNHKSPKNSQQSIFFSNFNLSIA